MSTTLEQKAESGDLSPIRAIHVGEILCVGTELLLGQIVNTNAAWLARQLTLLGISSYYQTVVGDNPDRIRWPWKQQPAGRI